MIDRLTTLLRLSRRELVVLVLVFAASLPAVTARLYSSDEVEHFAYLRSLWFDRDVSFENEYRYFYDRHIAQSAGFHETFLERTTATGRRANYATMGSAVLWSPFYMAADVIVRVMRAGGSAVEADGYSTPYVMAVAYGSAFYGFCAILLSIGAARRVVEGSGSLAAAIAVWVGTPLLFYMYVAPPFSHACSAFAVALFVTVWLHVRDSWAARGMVALGASAALMVMVREQDAFFAAGPALDWALTFIQGPQPGRRPASRGSLLTGAALGLAAFAIAYAPQLLAYNALNGRPGPASDVARKMYWYAPHGLQVLASPAHGFLVWTPLAALSLAGLGMLAAGRRGDPRRIAICALVMIAAQAYISGSVASWTVAGAFGQRRFVAVTILLVIGLAALLATLRGTSRRVAAALVVVFAWWNIALMAQFALRLMDRQRMEPARNAYHAFVTLPRIAPALAYRYLFQRSSFYERPAGTTR